MNCDGVHDVLDLYLSGELKGEKMADLRLHLQECEHCARAVQADRELDNALRTAMLEETGDVSAELVEKYCESLVWIKKTYHAMFIRLDQIPNLFATHPEIIGQE